MIKQMGIEEYRSKHRNNYIVPSKMLVGLVIKAETQEAINSESLKIISEVEKNKEIKAMLFDLSKKMTEVAGKKGFFVIVPGFIPPEESLSNHKTIKEFIHTFVNSNKNAVKESNPSQYGADKDIIF